MGSLNSALLRAALAQGKSEIVVDDTPVAIRLRYKSSGTITSVIVTPATNIVMITSDGGTETFAFATYTTMGALVDAINASNYWEAKLLDAKRDDKTTNSDIVSTTITISDDSYYDVLIDTSVALDTDDDHIYTKRITYDDGLGQEKPKGAHRVSLQEVIYNVNVNGAEAKGFRIYEWDASAKVERLVYQVASVDATKTTINFAAGEGKITAGVGNDLIVRVVDTTSITDATDNYLNVTFLRE